MASNYRITAAKGPLVEILLSTYNGERYLSHLFDSILQQIYSNWRILVRDDGSNDSTTSIIHNYNRKYPDRFFIIEFSKKTIGYTQSFSVLLEAAKGDYIAFCDQDDIWVSNKLEQQMVEIQSLQNEIGKQKPILVHSDLKVCDYRLNCVSNSMWQYQKIDPQKMKDVRCLLVQNFVTGCTILMNRALADIVVPIPKEAIMFDWWVALLALEQGKIISIQEPLVLYRQHEGNAIGAKKWGIVYFASLVAEKRQLWKTTLKRTIPQAVALSRYTNNKDRDIIYQYSMLDKEDWFGRKMLYWRIGIKKYGWLRQISAWLFI